MASREVLVQALQEDDATSMIVSHHRHSLRHLSTQVFEIDHGFFSVKRRRVQNAGLRTAA
jgi:ATPase subunit of ABC transporter with duplicated ATPase domains